MPESTDHTLHVEQHKPLDFARARAVADSYLQDALEDVGQLRGRARMDFGQVAHGQVVNEPLSDYYRELDEAERGLRNARNALKAMRDPTPTPTERAARR